MKRRNIDIDHLNPDRVKAPELNTPSPDKVEGYTARKDLLTVLLLTILGLVVSSSVIFWLIPTISGEQIHFGHLFWAAVIAGLIAQTIDGAMGMAYGVTSTTLLMAFGVPPAAATGSVHMSEVFTTGFSGLSHWRLGNIDKSLFKRLLIPGVIGAVAGAYLVSFQGDVLKPFIAAYLIGIGVFIIFKAYRKARRNNTAKGVSGLALFGGFVDSVGGGGWGPVVTSTLIGRGGSPRVTIGSVNAAEFFIAIAAGVSFAIFLGFGYWQVIAGLIFGGLFAAPFAAYLTKLLPTRVLLVFVGLLIVCVSTFNLVKALT
jgi:uncharacterized protein